MSRKINKTDVLFVLVLLAGLAFHISAVFFQHIYLDEHFYYTIPLRLVNGESLVQHEWHLTQFSSLFTYLPVRIFTMLKGSTEGLIFFMRCVYIFIHTVVAVGIYSFFKEYKVWAVAASMMFYTQVSYAIYGISYHSMFAIFILLFTFCLISAVNKKSAVPCIGAGFCFGACCVCNPVLVPGFAVYALFCVIWVNKDRIIKKLSETLEEKNKKQRTKFRITDFDWIQPYGNLFSGKAFLFSLAGVGVMVVVCLTFFFSTGGTIESIFQNVENIIKSSEYELVGNSFVVKIHELFQAFSAISFEMPFLLLIMFVVLLWDKNRMRISRRAAYVFIAFAISCIYALDIFKRETSSAYVFSLPFAIFSVTCYILTEKKNKVLFYCMWCVCMVGAFIHGMVSNTLLTAAGVIISVANVAGVFFVRNLFCEMSTDWQNNSSKEKPLWTAVRFAFCAAMCAQIFFNGIAIYCFHYVPKDVVRVNTGPFAGMLMSEERHLWYVMVLDDLERIRKHSNKDDPILVLSDENWMYIYIDRMIANFTALESHQPESMAEYYSVNSDRVPKYIYIPEADFSGDTNFYYKNYNEDSIVKMFDYTEEELPGGLLLTVTGYKFDTASKTE